MEMRTIACIMRLASVSRGYFEMSGAYIKPVIENLWKDVNF